MKFLSIFFSDFPKNHGTFMMKGSIFSIEFSKHASSYIKKNIKSSYITLFKAIKIDDFCTFEQHKLFSINLTHKYIKRKLS